MQLNQEKWRFVFLILISQILALGMFLGIWIFTPNEILSSRDLNPSYLVIIGASTGLLLAILTSYSIIRKQKDGRWLEFTAIATYMIMVFGWFIHFLSYSSINYEGGIVQNAWYIQSNQEFIGIIIGVILACSVWLVYSSLNWIEKTTLQDNLPAIKILGTLILNVFVHFGILNYLFGEFGLIAVILYSYGTATCLVISYFIMHKEDYPATNLSDTIKQSAADEQIITNYNLKIYYRWLSVVIFIQFIVFALSIEDQGMFSAVNLMITTAVGIVLIAIWSATTKMKRVQIWRTPEALNPLLPRQPFVYRFRAMMKEQLGSVFFRIFAIVRPIAVLLLVGILSYGYSIPFGAPFYFALWSIFLVIGVIIFCGIAWKKASDFQILKLFYLISAGTLLAFCFFLNQDLLLNMYSYQDAAFDMIWPFQLLLSPTHSIIVGICGGYMLAYEWVRIGGQYTDASNRIFKAAFLVLFCLLLGITIRMSMEINPPGGTIVWQQGAYPYISDFRPDPFLEKMPQWGFWTSLAAIVSMLIMDVIPALLLKIKPSLKDRLNPESSKLISRIEDKIESHDQQKIMENPTIEKEKRTYINSQNKSKARGVILIGMILFGIIPIFWLYPQMASAYQAPLLGQDPTGIQIFGIPSNVRIDPKQALFPSNSQPVYAYNLSLSRNEYESMQMIFTLGGRSINGLTPKISNFIHESDNSAFISSENITIRYVENILSDQFPDKLVPFSMLHLIEQRNHIFWITAYAPITCKTGRYMGIINFTFGHSESIAVRLTINVWNFTMPTTRHLRANYGDVTDDANLLSTFYSHRINSYGIPMRRTWDLGILNSTSGYLAYLNETSNQWTFNWTWWDAQTQEYLFRGSNAFSLPNPMGMPREPEYWMYPNGTITEWGIRFARFYEGVQAHFTDLLINHNGTDYFTVSYIYFIDEFQMFVPENFTQQQYFGNLSVFLELIKSHAPDLKIMTTTPPTYIIQGLRDYIDIYCPVSYDYNSTEWNDMMAQGKEMWMYTCVGPTSPWPNAHAYNRLYEIRVLYWQAFHYNIGGFLFWSATAYYHGRYSLAYNGWGDGWFVYTDSAHNHYDSIRWENWRDANEDYEYLWLMNASISAMGNPTTSRMQLNELVNNIAQDTFNYCDSAADVTKARDTLGKWLHETNSAGAINVDNIGKASWSPL